MARAWPEEIPFFCKRHPSWVLLEQSGGTAQPLSTSPTSCPPKPRSLPPGAALPSWILCLLPSRWSSWHKYTWELSQNVLWAFLLPARASGSPSSARQRGDVVDPRTKPIVARAQKICFWSQPTFFLRGVYFSVFGLLLIISAKGSMVSFLREQKHEVCFIWGVCRVRRWLIAKRLLSRQEGV